MTNTEKLQIARNIERYRSERWHELQVEADKAFTELLEAHDDVQRLALEVEVSR